MATDVVLVERMARLFLPAQKELTLLQFGPLPTGRSYLISATGWAQGDSTEVRLNLEAFGAKDWVGIGATDSRWASSFSLVVAVTIPLDEDLFTVAKVTGIKGRNRAFIESLRLVVLPVDSVTVLPFSG